MCKNWIFGKPYSLLVTVQIPLRWERIRVNNCRLDIVTRVLPSVVIERSSGSLGLHPYALQGRTRKSYFCLGFNLDTVTKMSPASVIVEEKFVNTLQSLLCILPRTTKDDNSACLIFINLYLSVAVVLATLCRLGLSRTSG